MKQKNTNLSIAKTVKNDEFYTQLLDVNNELKHYSKHFKNKVVFCNCDDPKSSNFWEYFRMNFKHLELKRLVSTHFKKSKPSYKLEIIDDGNKNGKISELIAIKTPLKQNGDFRSSECIDILKESDIVVTNPPFSLFREYMAQLVEYKKKFIIIGNKNAITYKEVFRLMKDDRLWLGYTSPEKFLQPTGAVEKKLKGMTKWFTNIQIKKRHEDLILYKIYKGNEKDYPKYDNYNAINVNKTKDIPIDHKGAMGVPITFMDKYNPDQFEIVSCNDYIKNSKTPFKEHGLVKDKDSTINGKAKYVRILIKKKQKVTK